MPFDRAMLVGLIGLFVYQCIGEIVVRSIGLPVPEGVLAIGISAAAMASPR